jgi:uncharacterized protein
MAQVQCEMRLAAAARSISAARPDRIILFGSAARGAMTKDSDIDLLIVAPNSRNPRQESILIRRALGDVGYPVDVIVMAAERFEETKNVIGGIAYTASRHGRILYAAADFFPAPAA